MTTVTREDLGNGKFCYRVDGKVVTKASKKFYEQAQKHVGPDGEVSVTFGKTKGGGNHYLKKYWVCSLEVETEEGEEPGPWAEYETEDLQERLEELRAELEKRGAL